MEDENEQREKRCILINAQVDGWMDGKSGDRSRRID